jgi:hypothetical protein
MNDQSSRSHVLLHIDLDIRYIKFPLNPHLSSITLADLAGSECLEKTKTKGKNTREGSMINKSLLSLSTVISKLSKKEDYVGFRESKLTRILQPILTGNCLTSVICTVSPLKQFYQESVNTLKFGTCAGAIKRKIEVSFKETSSSVLDMKQLTDRQSAYEDLATKHEEMCAKLKEKEDAYDILVQEFDDLKHHTDLVEKEKDCYMKEMSTLNEDVKKQSEEIRRLANISEELEERIYNEFTSRFNHMFEQQELVIKNLQAENDRLIEETKAGSKYPLMACMKRPFGSSSNNEEAKRKSRGAEELGEAPVSKAGEGVYEKQKVEIANLKALLQSTHQEMIKHQKIAINITKELSDARRQIEELSGDLDRPRRKVIPNPERQFDRKGELIDKRIQNSPNKEELKREYKSLRYRSKTLEREIEKLKYKNEYCSRWLK